MKAKDLYQKTKSLSRELCSAFYEAGYYFIDQTTAQAAQKLKLKPKTARIAVSGVVQNVSTWAMFGIFMVAPVLALGGLWAAATLHLADIAACFGLVSCMATGISFLGGCYDAARQTRVALSSDFLFDDFSLAVRRHVKFDIAKDLPEHRQYWARHTEAEKQVFEAKLKSQTAVFTKGTTKNITPVRRVTFKGIEKK